MCVIQYNSLVGSRSLPQKLGINFKIPPISYYKIRGVTFNDQSETYPIIPLFHHHHVYKIHLFIPYFHHLVK